MKKITPKTDDYMTNGPMVGSTMKSKKEPVKIYPRLRLEHQFFPECKDMKVGKTYTIELQVKCTGLSISKFQNDSEFDITGYELEDANDSDDSSDGDGSDTEGSDDQKSE